LESAQKSGIGGTQKVEGDASLTPTSGKGECFKDEAVAETRHEP